MKIKILLFSLILTSCGNNTKPIKNKLENVEPLSSVQIASYQKKGTMTRGNPSKVLYEEKSYIVSIYSSKSAQDFVNKLVTNEQVPIIFTGGIQGNQIVIETIQRQ